MKKRAEKRALRIIRILHRHGRDGEEGKEDVDEATEALEILRHRGSRGRAWKGSVEECSSADKLKDWHCTVSDQNCAQY